MTAAVRDHSTSGSYEIRAQYVVAADGAHSTVREKLNIPVEGKGTLDEHFLFIYFRAPWDELMKGYESDAILIENPSARGMFVMAEKDLGMFVMQPKSANEKPTTDRAGQLIRTAMGKSDIPVEVIEVAAWQPEQRVAKQFQQGRIFLLGDAAHTMPPKEGLGVNTAIQSAQNLGWKLAPVIAGRGGQELLSTYQRERQPVARFVTKHSMTGPAAALLENSNKTEKRSEFFPIVGYRYESRAVVSENGSSSHQSDDVQLLDREELTGIPGTRIPHIWLDHGGERISTLDLLDGRFVLITDDSINEEGADALASNAIGIEIRVCRIGPNGDFVDPENRWTEKLGISSGGAVLVRPDGFVAWRAKDRISADEPSIKRALSSVLCVSEEHPSALRIAS